LRLLEQLPAVIATRERFAIFRKQLQERLTAGFTAASVPCGLMGELLLLDYSGHPDLKLIGIDLDQHALDGAQTLAQTRQLADRLTLRQGDAWSTGLKGEVDLLASNGLNIYEPDNERVIALYRSFHDALKPGGTLVTSFLTPPPMLSPDSPWDMSALDPAALAFQHLLFTRVIEAKWNVFRTHAQTAAQLEEAGFTGVEFIDDRARLFPTVIARKSP
jgi:SAM-dependent methyltransferase